MSLTVSGSFGASVGSPQRFSREFLARQLPGFQERVPKGTQVGVDPERYREDWRRMMGWNLYVQLLRVTVAVIGRGRRL